MLFRSIARINLYKKYPKSLKVVHLLPALFTIGIVFLLLYSLVCSWSLSLLLLLLLLLPEARYVFLLFFPFLAELERAMLSLPLYYNMRIFRLPCSAGSHC